MRPEFLKPGDTIGVMAIASAPSQAQLAANWKEQLESWGLKVKIGKNVIIPKGHIAYVTSFKNRSVSYTYLSCFYI